MLPVTHNSVEAMRRVRGKHILVGGIIIFLVILCQSKFKFSQHPLRSGH